jgi:hypothetical protein
MGLYRKLWIYVGTNCRHLLSTWNSLLGIYSQPIMLIALEILSIGKNSQKLIGMLPPFQPRIHIEIELPIQKIIKF